MKMDYPPKNTILEQKDEYKSSVEAELDNNFKVLHTPFLLERLGGVERSINKSLVPALFNSPEHAFSSTNYILDYFVKNNISTEEQLQMLKGIQLSLNDIQLLAEDKEATYENVQFAYQWAGQARDEWNLSQGAIKSILDSTIKGIEKERTREDIPYLTSIYLDPENMLSKKSKIERFMQNVTPNLIDEANHIYHFDPTGESPIFLKLDTEEKRQYVTDFLSKTNEGWSKMFEETPTVKTYTHYSLPNEFKNFLLSKEEIKNYFPHIAFEGNKDILRGDMKNMLNPGVRDALRRDVGIDLTELGQEQAYFVEYISHKKRGEILPLKDFVEKYGKEGIKTFISCAHNQEMGDKILNLGEELLKEGKKEVAEEIFKKYGEYVDAVNTVEEEMNRTYKQPASKELINKTKEGLLIRGRDLLLNQNKKLLDKTFSSDKAMELLKNTKVGTDLFKDIFKAVLESNPETPIEDFSGLTSEQITSRDEITEEEINNVRTILKKNYSNEELRNKVTESFEKAINSGSTTFNLLKRDGKIIALDRIDNKEDETAYFGSFNVDPLYCSSKIGAAFFKATVVPQMKEKIVRADCSSRQPIAAYYIESGFIANSMYDYAGEPSFSLESDPKKHFSSKDLSKEEIIKLYANNPSDKKMIVNSASSQEEITSKIPDGYALTRYFFNKNSKQWFSVLEQSN